MAGVQDELRVDEFNNLVKRDILNAYSLKVTGKDIDKIVSISDLDSLNLFPLGYLDSKSSEEQAEILKVFTDCVEKNNFRDFVSLIEVNFPGISNRSIEGYEEAFRSLLEKTRNKESLTYSELFKGIKNGNSKVLNVARNILSKTIFRGLRGKYGEERDSSSAKQVLKYLSGLYYVNDKFESNANAFEHISSVTRHYLLGEKFSQLNKERLENMGIRVSTINNILNEDTIKFLASIDSDFEKNDIRDIERAVKIDEEITSIVATPYIRNLLNLPTGVGNITKNENGETEIYTINKFKGINELTGNDLVAFEKMLQRRSDDTSEDIVARLKSFCKVIESATNNLYENYSDKLNLDSEGKLVVSKEELQSRLVSFLGQSGAFAKENVEDFTYAALDTIVNYETILSGVFKEEEYEKIRSHKGNKKDEDNNLSTAYVKLEGKVYSLPDVKIEEDANHKFHLAKDQDIELLKRQLSIAYGKSFDKVTIEDFKFGTNVLAEEFLGEIEKQKIKEAQERETKQTQENANEQDSSSSASEDNLGSENNTVAENSKQNNSQKSAFVPLDMVNGVSVFTGSDIYLKALTEARKRVREAILSGQAEFVKPLEIPKAKDSEPVAGESANKRTGGVANKNAVASHRNVSPKLKNTQERVNPFKEYKGLIYKEDGRQWMINKDGTLGTHYMGQNNHCYKISLKTRRKFYNMYKDEFEVNKGMSVKEMIARDLSRQSEEQDTATQGQESEKKETEAEHIIEQ